MPRSILFPLLGLGAIVLFGTTRAARPAFEAPPPRPSERVEITTPEPTVRAEPPAPPPAPTLRSEAEADPAEGADDAQADSTLAADGGDGVPLAPASPTADEDGP